MPNRADLQALIERIEKATGPDRGLDARVQQALFPDQRVMLDRGKAFGPGPKRPAEYGTLSDVDLSDWDDARADQIDKDGLAGLFEAPPYTASVDADLALLERVLPGWRAEIRWGDWPQHIERHDATLWNNDTSKRESVFGVSANAATLPLAIIAATLRAMHQEIGPRND